MPGATLRSRERRHASLSALDGPLSFRTLPEQIAAKIRQAILTGRLPPGSRFVETRVAEEMKTSRGPVRDALALLERDGLVVRLPNRGACVLDFSERTLREAASLRAVLEEFAVSLAVQRLTAEDLTQLESLVQGMEVAARRRATLEFNELDYRFHNMLFEASGHQTLHETWLGMQRRIRAFLASTNLVNNNLHRVAQLHRAIFEALASRRVTSTRRAIRAHFSRLEEELDLLCAARKPSRRQGIVKPAGGGRAAS